MKRQVRREFQRHGLRASRRTNGKAALPEDLVEDAIHECQTSFQTSSETTLDPLVLLRPLRDDAQEIVGFVYEDANRAACADRGLTREELVGMRALGPFTHVAPTGLIHAYATVFETGEPFAVDDFLHADSWGATAIERFFHLRATRTNDLLALTWRDVTDRHIAEAERSRLATIVASSEDAIMSIDRDLRITSWNHGAEVIYGYLADDVMGESSDLLIAPGGTLEARKLWGQINAGEVIRSYEAQGVRKDGTLIDVAITAFPLLDGDGEVCGAASITRDITRHHDDVRELAESEARYREILDTTPDGVWRVDAEGRTDYVNRRMASMLGYSREEMIGRELSEFVRPGSTRVGIELAGHDGQPAVDEICFSREDGTACWTRVSHRATTDKAGTYAGSLAIISDISASKAQAVELRETEHFLAALTDSMADGMFALGRDARVTYLNPVAEELLGWTRDELATRSMHDAIHYQLDDGSPNPARDSQLLGALRTGRSVRVDDDAFTRRDGRLLPVTYSAAPVCVDGQVHGVVVVFRDVSLRRAKEERHKRELETLNWVGRIRDALDQDRLVLRAQPIIDLRTREVVTHELLLRMVDLDGAIISPGRFVPAAEQFGLIEEIDRWVLAQSAGLAASGLKVHFNISGRSLGSGLLISDLVRALRDTGIDPGLLVCEITETALAKDAPTAEAFVRELTGLGCEVVLDDFGMGYGGFGYLKRLPVTALKIDIEFVRDLVESRQNQHVVKAIVTLAQGFGRKTIAEGVETEATLTVLEQSGVDYAQGYYIGRPASLHPIPLSETRPLQSSNGTRPEAAWSRGH